MEFNVKREDLVAISFSYRRVFYRRVFETPWAFNMPSEPASTPRPQLCARRLDLEAPELEPALYRRIQLKGDFNPEDFETRQEFAVSADGTRVPMFIVQRAGTPRDGNNPTLLYGYGGARAALHQGLGAQPVWSCRVEL